MAEKSGIAWTRSTFNPWIGCTKVGPGCDNCYAAALDQRFKFGGATHWGSGVARVRTKPSNWYHPQRWNAQAMAEKVAGTEWNGRRGFWPVFCASLADVFDNEVPRLWRFDLWRLIEDTPHLDWLIVTKRIGNVVGMVPVSWETKFPDNVRLMITVCNQVEATRDLTKLLSLPCRNGVSYEPALGPVDWRPWLTSCGPNILSPDPHGRDKGLEWIIVGGESTQGDQPARPFDLRWATSTIAQCREAGVPVFMKQIGSNTIESADPHKFPLAKPINVRDFGVIKDRAGADPDEWPPGLLRVREFPV